MRIYVRIFSSRFTWDPHKSEANLVDRGFDFEFAALIFGGLTLERADKRKDYGEERVIAHGIADGNHLTVVYTDRSDVGGEVIRRIISARVSNRRERKGYEQFLAP